MFEGVELGTEATRTGIIDNARKSRYIELRKDTYLLLPAGKNLIESLNAMNISMDKYKTCELGRALKQVYRGEITVEESVALAEREIGEIFSRSAPPKDVEVHSDTGALGEIVGVCPKCSRNVIRGNSAYGCIGYKDGCDFRVGTHICHRDVPKEEISRLLATGSTGVIRGFLSKNGKRFDGCLVLRDGRAVFDFPERR
jgi:DNA topoisomerase-3